MKTEFLALAGLMALGLAAPGPAKAADWDAPGWRAESAMPVQYYGDDDEEDQSPDDGYDPRPRWRPDVPPPAPRPIYRRGISCWEGARLVDDAGFYRVRPRDCVAPIFEYRAYRRGQAWNVRLSARTGRILL